MYYRGGRAGPKIQGNLGIQEAIRDLAVWIQIPQLAELPDPNNDSEEEEKKKTALLERIKKMTSHTLIGMIIFQGTWSKWISLPCCRFCSFQKRPEWCSSPKNAVETARLLSFLIFHRRLLIHLLLTGAL